MTSPEFAAASVAYAVSNLVYVIEPNNLKSSVFKHSIGVATDTLIKYKEQAKKNVFNEETEVEIIHANADPFSNLYASIVKGSLVSVVIPLNTSKTILIQAIPHLYKIANNRSTSTVIHVAVDRSHDNNVEDYTDVMALRQTGCVLLHSSGTQETWDLSLIAHALSIKTGVPVIHFFDRDDNNSSKEKNNYLGNDVIKKLIEEADIIKYKETLASTIKQNERYFRSIVLSSDEHITDESKINGGSNGIENPKDSFLLTVDKIFVQFKKETGRSYKAIEFIGDNKSDSLIITIGSGSKHIKKHIQGGKILQPFSMVNIRVYRPWSEKYLFDLLPKKINKIIVLEQVVARTTKWTPMYLDIVAAFQNHLYWTNKLPIIASCQYGSFIVESIGLEITTLFQNLSSSEPRRNLVIGHDTQKENGINGVNGITNDINGKIDPIDNAPTLEKPYLKMLLEVFKDRLFIANVTSKSNVGHLESTPEFGFGVLLAKLQKRDEFANAVTKIVKNTSVSLPEPLLKALSQWLLYKDDSEQSKNFGNTAIEYLNKIKKPNPSLTIINNQQNLFAKPANWLIGSDSWAYDIGASGVHHVISSGKDINILIIDSQPYTTRTAADPEKRKKDIGLYAMNYGDIYVASVAIYSSYTQVLHALMEAEKYKGPSIVLAYLPYYSEEDTTITVLKETKLAVDTGYWPLYRWNPALEKEGKEPFTLDSERIKSELQSFLDRENQLSQLINTRPELSETLTNSLESEVKLRQKSLAKSAYEKLLGGLSGPPLLILFGSDNGNAEGLAKRLQKGAKARGVNARCMAMDDYPIEEIITEKNIVFSVCTAGQGEFPQNAREFWKTISSTTEISFSDTQFAVFGLGDSKYWPREEDIIYYNKPGKELFARLELLAWEPELWKALGVELLGTVVEERKKTDDDMKDESNFLRGTIAEGLEDTSTGALCERDTKLTKFHGIYQQDDRDLRDERKAQKLEKAYSFMVRVRVPGGVSTPKQWLAMDEISDKHANGSLKMTTRQAYQLHGVLKRNLRTTIREINKCLLDTLAACGDVNRNVMCNPNPYISEIHSQVFEFSKKLSAHLSPQTSAYHEIWLEDKIVAGQAVQDVEPLYGPTYLPRKFKIAIATPPSNDVDVYAHDLGFIAITDDHNKKLLGYNVTVGGGMGMTHNNKKTYPRLADSLGFCKLDQAVDVAEKVMLVQRDFGDRTNRKHARLKYTIDDRSIDWFRSEVESRLGYKLEKSREFQFKDNSDRFGWTKGLNDKWHFCMYIENGRVKDFPGLPFKTGLREIAKIHKGDFRLTPNQHLVISNVPEKEKPKIEELLKKYKLDNLQFTGLRLNSMACVALPTCGLAMAESERYLPLLVSKLESIIEEVGLKNDAITIRMTGCPNGCARPYVAEIAFVGKAMGTYNVYLGGGFHGQRLNKLYKDNLKEDEILKELKPILARYAKEKLDGERFGDFVIRTGYVKATTCGKDFHS
ncbi:11013_t:CDS:2 [Diversispora eburnea]|uniref:assimilatory sulfite reductase (NADPH) n=1 Tax=Diversispora eburnea TaxID=1213867 RepID=A0A9N8ZGA8_9GLOM|nr:11013_t:CDS:2 [Diversispora eburnea]